MSEKLALALTALAVALRDQGWESGPLTALVEAAEMDDPAAFAAKVAAMVEAGEF